MFRRARSAQWDLKRRKPKSIVAAEAAEEQHSGDALCAGCANELRVYEGSLVCSGCGAMQAMVDSSAEWRFYGDDGSGENPARCGMPINNLLRESSLACIVLSTGKCSFEMKKIQRITSWMAMPYGEKTLYDAYQQITVMASIAGISKMIIDLACHYHQTISANKTFRGNNRDSIIAASIYLACRVKECPRTAKEIAEMFNLEHASATKGCTNAMKIINEFDHATRYSVTSPHSFIERFCTNIGISPELTRLAEFIALQIEKHHLITENAPNAVAAGIVYFIATEFNLGLDKHLIRQVSTISEVTILRCYKKVESNKDKLIPPQVYAMFKTD